LRGDSALWHVGHAKLAAGHAHETPTAARRCRRAPRSLGTASASARKSGSCSMSLPPPAQGHHSRCSRRKRSRKIVFRSRDAPRRPTRRCDGVLSYAGSRATRQGAAEVISFDFLEEETRKIKPGRLQRRRRWGWSLMSDFSQYGLLWSGKNPTCWSHAAAPIGPPIGANTCEARCYTSAQWGVG
jgi:hypothetical protein